MYELVERLAKASNKSLSRFAAELLTQAVKQDMRETSTLNKLIQKLEKLDNFQPQQNDSRIDELKLLFVVLYVLVRNSVLQLLPFDKKQILMSMIDEFERDRLGATIYDLFAIKRE